MYDMLFEIISVWGARRQRMKQSEQSLSNLQDSNKYTNIYILGISEEEVKVAECLLKEIMAKSSSSLRSSTDVCIQEA